MQNQAPVTEFIPEALEYQGAIVGQVTGSFALLVQVGNEVRCGEFIQALGSEPRRSRLGRGGAELPAVGAERRTELSWPAWRIALPERQPAWLPTGRGDEHLVCGDVLDPPRGRAEDEDVADARLVHHLLVQLAHAPGMPSGTVGLAASQEHAEQAAVRNRPAVADSQPLAAWPAA